MGRDAAAHDMVMGSHYGGAHAGIDRSSNPRTLENPTFVEKIPIANPTRARSRLRSVELIGAGFGTGSPTDQIEK
jgi:hypothetical protein